MSRRVITNQNDMCTEDALHIHITLYKFYSLFKDFYTNEYFEEYRKNHILLVTLTKSQHERAIRVLSKGVLKLIEDSGLIDDKMGRVVKEIYEALEEMG